MHERTGIEKTTSGGTMGVERKEIRTKDDPVFESGALVGRKQAFAELAAPTPARRRNGTRRHARSGRQLALLLHFCFSRCAPGPEHAAGLRRFRRLSMALTNYSFTPARCSS